MEPAHSEPGVIIYHGDCLAVLPELAENSVDACVCDPPYGLEFMGKEWDRLDVRQPNDPTFHRSGVGPFDRAKVRHSSAPSYGGSVGGAIQAWHEQWARAVLRVLKPGAHLLAFGGTRTHHRLMCALEDAGFEIRDTLMWLYGCLSDDTEILVDGQWEHYSKATPGRLSLCYDSMRDEFSWRPIQRLHVYPYDDTAYHLHSNRTDQIVSRTHRCVVERGGTFLFEQAEILARQREAHVPVLEDVRDVLDALPVPHERAGNSEQDLWFGMLKPRPESPTVAAAARAAEGDDADRMCCLPAIRLQSEVDIEEGGTADVLASLQRSITQSGAKTARPQGTGRVDESLCAVVSFKNVRVKEPRVEGWNHLLPQTRALQADQVRSLPVQVFNDGATRRVRDGAPVDRGEGAEQESPASRGRSPRRPRSSEQRGKQFDAVRLEPRPQAVRASWFTTTDLARIEPVHYRGIVWCVSVPTGAFVVRRNGQVFVTGNSGFPKSLDVSKAIDRAAGAEREVGGSSSTSCPDFPAPCKGHAETGRYSATVHALPTLPVTDLAKKWQGWGTALKPAWEPIILARKPLSEPNVAANVLRWGTGALNIDGARIEGTNPSIARRETARRTGTTPTHDRPAREATAAGRMENRQNPETYMAEHPGEQLGRWPSNLLLNDESAAMLDAQSGESQSPSSRPRCPDGPAKATWALGREGGVQVGHGDSGGASRFFFTAKADRVDRDGSKHPTIKPTDLMGYLVRLVTPPGGLVLDPFMGSGPTIWAAREYGFRAIGIDRELEYVDDAVRRLRQGLLL